MLNCTKELYLSVILIHYMLHKQTVGDETYVYKIKTVRNTQIKTGIRKTLVIKALFPCQVHYYLHIRVISHKNNYYEI